LQSTKATGQPYVSKAAHRRAQWRTLTETLAHIQKQLGCDWHTAVEQWRLFTHDYPFAVLDRDDLPDPWRGPRMLGKVWEWQVNRAGLVFDPRQECWRELLQPEHLVRAGWPEPKTDDTRSTRLAQDATSAEQARTIETSSGNSTTDTGNDPGNGSLILEEMRKLPRADDEHVHLCINALHKTKEPGTYLNRPTLWKKAPAWLAEKFGVYAPSTQLTRCLGDKQHKAKKRGVGSHS
jgi:hypothetical protein